MKSLKEDVADQIKILELDLGDNPPIGLVTEDALYLLDLFKRIDKALTNNE